MARSWKDGYLQGLNVCLQWQEENERLIKNSVKQGLSGTHQFLTWWKGLIEDQAQRQADAQRADEWDESDSGVHEAVYRRRSGNGRTDPQEFGGGG